MAGVWGELALEPELFLETLNVSVALTSEAATARVDGGNIKELDLQLRQEGHSGSVRIWVDAQEGDEFFALVLAPALLEIEITVAKSLFVNSPPPQPLKIRGAVVRRRFREIPSADVQANPILYREYTLDFCDHAQALWSQHRPSAVYARTTFAKVIQQNTPAKLKVKLAWPELNASHDMICLGLGEDRASFRDLVFWFADTRHGYVWYDYSEQTLVLDAEKPAQGSLQVLPVSAVGLPQNLQVEIAEPPRQAIKLLNSWDGADQEHIAPQPNQLDGVRRDYLLHTAINSAAQQRQTTEEVRASSGKFQVGLCCVEYPEMYFAPGTRVGLDDALSEALFLSGQTLRVLDVSLHAKATHTTPEYDLDSDTTEYNVSLGLRLEATDDPRLHCAPYIAPRYPFLVEGKVLSALGKSGDRPYTVYEDEGTSARIYKVNFALWNATIAIPTTPDFVPGHLYIPANKDSRALIELHFDSARIARFLDWGTGVTVPNASQGNHILLGKNATSETSIRHWYAENSPELRIGRTHLGDLGTLTVKEGTITLETNEDESASSAAATTSVEPQAQMAKAQAEQDSELAVMDLQETTQAASGELEGSVRSADRSLRQQADQLGSQVKDSAKKINTELQSVTQGIDQRITEAETLVREARQKLDKLLKS